MWNIITVSYTGYCMWIAQLVEHETVRVFDSPPPPPPPWPPVYMNDSSTHSSELGTWNMDKNGIIVACPISTYNGINACNAC